MSETMMVWGEFVFSLPTMVYQELARRTAWTYGRNKRMGARDGVQFLGPGDDTINLAGYLVPDVIGSASSLAQLRAQAAKGQALPLVAGDGTVFGPRLCTTFEERQSHLKGNGGARRYDFSMELLEVDPEDALDPSAKPGAFNETVEVDDTEKEVLETELAAAAIA